MIKDTTCLLGLAPAVRTPRRLDLQLPRTAGRLHASHEHKQANMGKSKKIVHQSELNRENKLEKLIYALKRSRGYKEREKRS